MSSEAPRVVLLTGAGGGIGLAIAENLLSHGARVVGVDLITARLSDLKARYDAQLEIVTGDVGERSTSAQAVEIATNKFGRLDSIILNAAILAPVGPVADTDVEGWRKLFDVNFFALLHTIQISMPQLRQNKGSIIMTSSGVSLRPNKAWNAYAAAKRAMNSVCAGLDLEEPDVSTVCITPGIVDTGIQKQVRENRTMVKPETDKATLPPEQYNWLNDMYEKGELVSPEKPASTFAKLALRGVPQEVRGKVVAWDDKLVEA